MKKQIDFVYILQIICHNIETIKANTVKNADKWYFDSAAGVIFCAKPKKLQKVTETARICYFEGNL